MTQEQQKVRDWMVAFDQETPEKPTIPSIEIRKLRAKLILEEALETVWALGFEVFPGLGRRDVNLTKTHLDFVESPLGPMTLADIADGCSDLSVVNYGTLVACGLVKDYGAAKFSDGEIPCDIDPLFDEVMKSNWSKMWTRDEVQKEFNRDIGAFQLNETKRFEDCHVTFIGKEAAFKDRCYLVKNDAGKVLKSPSYSPANLQPIIDAL